VALGVVFLAGPQVRPSATLSSEAQHAGRKAEKSTAGLVRESYLTRKQTLVKRASSRVLNPRRSEAALDDNRLDVHDLSVRHNPATEEGDCHHPKCARPKEFSVAVGVIPPTSRLQGTYPCSVEKIGACVP
jgi:hypothetical protein